MVSAADLQVPISYYGLHVTTLGVFSWFFKICSPEEQEFLIIPALFLLLWAFSASFPKSVPFCSLVFIKTRV